MLWPEEFAKTEALVKNDLIGFVRGTLNRSRDPAELVVSRSSRSTSAGGRSCPAGVVRLQKGVTQPDDLERLHRLLRVRPGNLDVYPGDRRARSVRRAIYKAGAASRSPRRPARRRPRRRRRRSAMSASSAIAGRPPRRPRRRPERPGPRPRRRDGRARPARRRGRRSGLTRADAAPAADRMHSGPSSGDSCSLKVTARRMARGCDRPPAGRDGTAIATSPISAGVDGTATRGESSPVGGPPRDIVEESRSRARQSRN